MQYAPRAAEATYGAHSVYFRCWPNTDTSVSVCTCSWCCRVFCPTRRLRKTATGSRDKSRALRRHVQLSLIAFLISGIFLGRAYFDYYFTLVACISILERVSERTVGANGHGARKPSRRWAAQPIHTAGGQPILPNQFA